MSVTALFLASLLPGANALLPLVIHDKKFYQVQEDYNKPAELVTIFGVDYQPGGASDFNLGKSSDVLTNAEACKRDAYLLNQLGANAIRVYSVSPWLNHDECMTIFNDAGIYVLLDVNTPDSSINRGDPSSSYHEGYLNNVFGLVDAFKNYPNLLGFIAGNEIINDGPSAKKDPTYVRAVIRDVKDYISQWSNRTIPVGYAAADVLEYRKVTWEYLECNANTGNYTTDVLSRADFFGINTYSWCSGSNDYQNSGYGDILSTFNQSTIPIIFTEYGCNKNLPRTFEEVDGGIYGPLKDVVSGSFVYEYSNEVSNYGLVELDDDGNVSLLKDYDNLKSAFSKVSIQTSSVEVTSTPTGTEILKSVPTCASIKDVKDFDWNFDLPPCPGTDMIKSNGGNKNVGTLVESLSSIDMSFKIKDSDGKEITPTFSYDKNFQINSQTNAPAPRVNRESKTVSLSTTSSAASTTSTSTSTAAASSTSAATSSHKSKNGSPQNNGRLGLPMAVAALVGGSIMYLI